MSSLYKAFAVAGLASTANAMLLKKGCSDSNDITKVTDMCSLLKFAKNVDAKPTLAKSGNDGKEFTITANGDTTAHKVQCKDVENCNPDTGLVDTTTENKSKVVDAKRGAIQWKTGNEPAMTVTEACKATSTDTDITLVGDNLCGLLKAFTDAADGTVTEVVKGKDANKIKVTIAGKSKDGISCEAVKKGCDKTTGNEKGSGTDATTPSSDDMKLEGKAKSGVQTDAIATACKDAGATWDTGKAAKDTSMCFLMGKLHAQAVSTTNAITGKAEGKSGNLTGEAQDGSTDNKFSVTIVSADAPLDNSVKFLCKTADDTSDKNCDKTTGNVTAGKESPVTPDDIDARLKEINTNFDKKWSIPGGNWYFESLKDVCSKGTQSKQ